MERNDRAHRTDVSVLGLGAIGTKVTEALLAAGSTVTVWNRTPSRAHGLVEGGAAGASSPAEAATASPLVILCLSDYAAVDTVLEAASHALPDRTIVTLTTGSPAEARHAARKAQGAGADYLDGGVQAEPLTIGTAAALFLYSGSESAFTEHRATLEAIGTARYLGEDPAAAAVHDLALFGLWYDTQVGYLRALETIRLNGIKDVYGFAAAAARQLGHVVNATEQTARELMTNEFPRGPADLVEHASVLERLIDLRSETKLGSGGLDRIRDLVEQLIAQGHGREGLTRILASED